MEGSLTGGILLLNARHLLVMKRGIVSFIEVQDLNTHFSNRATFCGQPGILVTMQA